MAYQRKGQLIIGLGSGRSGTTSLTGLLASQTSSFFVHEGSFLDQEFLLPWERDSDLLEKFFELLEEEGNGADFYGCVALYFLPYVDDILKKYPKAKFVCLVRDRSQVIRSFMVHSDAYNWWMNHDGTMWKKDATWDPSFPKVDAVSKEEAIGKYWDLYNRQVLLLQQKYPESFRVFPLEFLNTSHGMNSILDFAGYPSENRVLEVVHTNSTYTMRRTIRRWAERAYLGTAYRFLKRLLVSHDQDAQESQASVQG